MPGYFQEIMEQLTKDMCGVAVYMDDILVSGNNAQVHFENLMTLFRHLNEKVHVLHCNLSAYLLNLVLNTWDTPCQGMELPRDPRYM